MEAAGQPIEPQFLAQALAQSIPLRISQVNKSELEGIVREIGRYEINFESGGSLITVLKQEISSLSSPVPLVTVTTDARQQSSAPPPVKPNIQQEFLDKAIKERHHLTIFLLSGQRIRATIEAYDNFTILVRDGGRQHLYYKHAITTINR